MKDSLSLKAVHLVALKPCLSHLQHPAHAFIALKELHTLLVDHKEAFKRIDPSYDAILIDDANVSELKRTEFLGLVDGAYSKTIRILYDTVTKKKGVVTIININYVEAQKMKKILSESAVLRRTVIYRPQSPFIVNVNIQQNNIIYNGDVYNGDIHHHVHNVSEPQNEPTILSISEIQENEQKQINLNREALADILKQDIKL